MKYVDREYNQYRMYKSSIDSLKDEDLIAELNRVVTRQRTLRGRSNKLN